MMSMWTNSFLTKPELDPVMELWAKLSKEAAGLVDVHSSPKTGAEWTATSLSTSPVLTLRICTWPVTVPTASKGLYSPQFLVVSGGHILTALEGDKEDKIADTVRRMLEVEREDKVTMGMSMVEESADPRLRKKILPSVVRKATSA